MRWSLLAVVVISLALVTSGCLRKNKHYTTYSGVDPGMSLAQAKDYCGAIASSAKSGAKSAFQQAQNKKKKKRYWSDGMFVHEQEVSGGFAGGFAEGLAKGLKGNAAYSRVMKGCMAEQGYKLTSKTTSTYKPKPEKTVTASTSSTSSGKTVYCYSSTTKTVYSLTTENSTGWCGANEIITKAEYDRLGGKKTVTASKSTTVYCKAKNGNVYKGTPKQCYRHRLLTKFQYDRLKGETDTDTVEVKRQEALAETTIPTEIQSTKAKLRGLKEMLDEGLITKEEAAAKRAKLLEDL